MNLFNLLPVALWVDAVVIASESFLESAIVNPIATAKHNENVNVCRKKQGNKNA